MKRIVRNFMIVVFVLVSLAGPATAFAKKPLLGFGIAVATDGFLSTKLSEVKVASIKEGSASEKAGLKLGDLILEMNGRLIKGSSGPAMKKILTGTKAGEHLLLKVKRNNGVLLIDIVAGS